MANLNIKVVDSFRDAKDNEFFFRNDPYATAGIKEMLVWLEQCDDYDLISIPQWQIQTKTIGDYSGSYSYGIRIIKR